MSRPRSFRMFEEVFSRWPKQALRPDHQLQDVLGKAMHERYQHYQPSMEAEEVAKVKALQYLLQDRYKTRFKLRDRILSPKSQPTYFDDLVREIEEAPNRTWLERLGKKLQGMIRFK